MPSTSEYVKKLTHLRRGRVGGHERPHKPTLLLAIISLIESGKAADNRIVYGPELLELFKRYFEVVKDHDDALNSMDPFWRLRTDGFFHHHAREGKEAVIEATSGAPALQKLQEMSDFSYLDEDLFALLKDPQTRTEIQGLLMDTYFPDQAKALQQVIAEESGIAVYEDYLKKKAADETQNNDEPPAKENIRNAAFGRVVRSAYDYQCAACGLRVLVDDLAIVDAAHIIPVSVSRDNDPRNGMALCKNHHWAMDRNLVVPCPDLKWHASKALDDRIEGHRSLMEINGRSILLPKETRYAPKQASLAWREEQLKGA